MELLHADIVPRLLGLWSFATLSLFTIKQLKATGQEQRKTDNYLVRKELDKNEIVVPTLGLVSCFIS